MKQFYLLYINGFKWGEIASYDKALEIARRFANESGSYYEIVECKSICHNGLDGERPEIKNSFQPIGV